MRSGSMALYGFRVQMQGGGIFICNLQSKQDT